MRYVAWPSAALIALIGANLVPLIGVTLFGWSVLEVFAVYWSENVVVGAFLILRLATSPALSIPAAAGLSLFFCAHFGLFCFVHSVFVVGIVGDRTAPHDFFAAPGYLLATAAQSAGGLGLTALIVSHGVSFVTNYLRRERHSGQPDLFSPYRRVIVMHVVLLAGVFLTFAVDGGPVMLALLVVAKIAADAMAHRAEHRRSASDPDRGPPDPGGSGGPDDDELDYIAIE